MKIHILVFCSCALLLTGCDAFHYRQYVIGDATFEDRETASIILAQAAQTAALEEKTESRYEPEPFANYAWSPGEGWQIRVWLFAWTNNTEMVICLSNFPDLTPHYIYKAADAVLCQELPKAFGERLTIDPKPRRPYPKWLGDRDGSQSAGTMSYREPPKADVERSTTDPALMRPSPKWLIEGNGERSTVDPALVRPLPKWLGEGDASQ